MKQLQKRFSRRNLLLISAALCLGTINQARAQEADVEINIVLDYGRGLWYYDPVGVFIQPRTDGEMDGAALDPQRDSLSSRQ